MKKEFIPYEETSSLIALGFNEPVIAHRNNGLNICLLEHPEVLLTDLSMILYQQAFRWFREKYGHAGFIELIEPEYDGDYGYIIYYKLNHLSVDHWNKGFKTYEEAELACLKKLIEIVKTK